MTTTTITTKSVTAQRGQPRVMANVDVTITMSSGEVRVAERLCDLSVSGVFIAMDPPLPKGESLDLSFVVPTAAAPIKCRGKVVWSNPGSEAKIAGIGVSLINLGMQGMLTLCDFIEEQIGVG